MACFYTLIFYNHTLPKIPYTIGDRFTLFEWACMAPIENSTFQLEDYYPCGSKIRIKRVCSLHLFFQHFLKVAISRSPNILCKTSFFSTSEIMGSSEMMRSQRQKTSGQYKTSDTIKNWPKKQPGHI